MRRFDDLEKMLEQHRSRGKLEMCAFGPVWAELRDNYAPEVTGCEQPTLRRHRRSMAALQLYGRGSDRPVLADVCPSRRVVLGAQRSEGLAGGKDSCAHGGGFESPSAGRFESISGGRFHIVTGGRFESGIGGGFDRNMHRMNDKPIAHEMGHVHDALLACWAM
jgi:hypothetical protein